MTETTNAHPTALMVGDFISTFNPNPDVWPTLVTEEAKEVREALAHLLKELCDLVYVIEGLKASGIEWEPTPEDQVFIAGALGFLQVYEALYGDGVTGYAFTLVHESNMSKVGDDGKPIYRDDGKVMKGPNYKPANLIPLILPIELWMVPESAPQEEA